MIDLLKAQVQKAKVQLQELFTDGLNEASGRIDNLETFKTNLENSNAPGSTQYFTGSVDVSEALNVKENITAQTIEVIDSITSQGEKLASENFVLANAGGGDGTGNVDMTLTYRYEATDGQTEFEFAFVGTSVGVFVSGVKMDTTDYSITVAEYDDEGNVTTPSKITLNEGLEEGEIFHGVAYGGADVYSRTQSNAAFIPRQEIIDNYVSQTQMQQMAANVEPVLLSSVADLQGDWVNYDDNGTSGWNTVIHKTWDGFVHISGIIKGDVNGTNIVENLATEFRPTKNIMNICQANDDGVFARVDVYPDGSIRVIDDDSTRPSDSTDWVSLNFVYYAGN